MLKYIVYDGETNDNVGRDIDEQARTLTGVLRRYSVPLESVKLSNWETTGDKNADVVYITTIESEHFHTKVKPLFLEGKSNCLLVLQHSPEEEKHVKRLETSIKKSLKKREPIKEQRKRIAQETLGRIVPVTDIKKVSCWLPHVLKFLIPAPVNTTRRQSAREIGVYFKINWDDEYQVEWLQMQKDALENVFNKRCRHNGSFMNEEVYIRSSAVVVMYADRGAYQKLRTNQAQLEGKKKLLNSINETRATCSLHATKFHVLFDQAGVKLSNVLANDYHLAIVGVGMINHWLGILSMLNLVRGNRVRDNMFYTERHLSRENELDRFNQDKYQLIYQRNPEITRITSPSGVSLRHEGSVEHVSFQSKDIAVTEDNVVTPSTICCIRRLPLNN